MRIQRNEITPEMAALGAKILSEHLKPWRRQFKLPTYHIPIVDIVKEVYLEMARLHRRGNKDYDQADVSSRSNEEQV